MRADAHTHGRREPNQTPTVAVLSRAQALHFHCDGMLGSKLALKVGEDAGRAMWLTMDPETELRYARLYASCPALRLAPAQLANPSPSAAPLPFTADMLCTMNALPAVMLRTYHWQSAARIRFDT